MATVQIGVHTQIDGIEHEIADVVHNHTSLDFTDAQWVASQSLMGDVTIMDASPAMEDAVKSCGLAAFMSFTTLD